VNSASPKVTSAQRKQKKNMDSISEVNTSQLQQFSASPSSGARLTKADRIRKAQESMIAKASGLPPTSQVSRPV